MRRFDQWIEAFIFASVFSLLIIIPCLLIVLVGRKMINRLGQYPSKTPAIQMSVLFQLVTIEIFGFFGLIAFYNFFSE